MSKRNRTELALHYLILGLIAIVFVLPMLWMVFASFDAQAIQALRLPYSPTLDNFSAILGSESIRRSFVNGFIISGGQSILVVLICILAAYPLSRFRMKHKKSVMMTILFLTSLPITAVMVPVYQLFLRLRFLDSIPMVTLYLTATALPYGIWMMKNFMDSVPLDLEESAWVDGASVFQGIRKVVTPLMIPGICTVAIFTFTGSWGNFFVPFMLLNSPDNLPSSVTIFQFFGQFGMVDFGRLAAFSVLQTLPVVVLYALSQSVMSKGFSLGGATKG